MEKTNKDSGFRFLYWDDLGDAQDEVDNQKKKKKMPTPSPKPTENKAAYVNRCTADTDMIEGFPDKKERVSECHTNWRKSIKG